MSGHRASGFHRAFRVRAACVALLLALAGTVLLGRAVHLQVFNTEFLNEQAAARHLRIATLSATRGMIRDRNGEPLAVSTPVDSVWVNPGQLVESPERIRELARAVGLDGTELKQRLTRNVNKSFMYLRRHMSPADAEAITALGIPGVHLLREYRRYYPAGEVVGHLLGFTNVDDQGQEGLELAFDNWLRGHAGRKQVLKDRLGRIVEDVESIEPPRPGGDLSTAIDLRLQYLAYRELKAAVQRARAASGSAVVLDVLTGEVLAMVNQPAYNPNDRSQVSPARYRNRAITDIFEPGSTFKPLIVAAALESGRYEAGSRVDTSPGYVQVGVKLIQDKHNLGDVDLQTILARSSNVGATLIAMSLDPEQLHAVLSGFGVGRLSATGFPGESAGLLPRYESWRPISQATLAYGYGVSMTPLQLAQAYAVLASGGLSRPVSLLRVEQPPIARRMISARTARSLVQMLEAVVAPGGTGLRAAVPGYRVAGKTGTARKLTATGYADNRYTAVFAGVLPTSRPRLSIVVIVDDPRGGAYYGGDVAAPVFASIAAGAMRLLAVAPDAPVPAVPAEQRRTMVATLP